MARARHSKVPKPTKRAVKASIKRRMPQHKRAMLHPIAIFTWLIVGVFLFNYSFKVMSESYSVNATVPAAPLGAGAAITYPANNQTFNVSPINISGVCPDNSYINLTRNNLFIGSAWCQNTTFVISSDLISGDNLFQAQDYNITDSPGPATAPVNVIYSQPATLTLPPPQLKSIIAQAKAGLVKKVSTNLPLIITSSYSFRTFQPKQKFTWAVVVQGGTKPYIVQTNWGDGTSQPPTLYNQAAISLMHIYAQSGYYPLKVQVVDMTGMHAQLQIAALIVSPGQLSVLNSRGCSADCKPSVNLSGAFINNWLWIIWSSYIVVMLMSLSFWLGMREEYDKLIKKYKWLLH